MIVIRVDQVVTVFVLFVFCISTYVWQLSRLQERLQTVWESQKIKSKRQVILYLIPFGWIPLTIHLLYTKVVTEIKIFRHYFNHLP